MGIFFCYITFFWYILCVRKCCIVFNIRWLRVVFKVINNIVRSWSRILYRLWSSLFLHSFWRINGWFWSSFVSYIAGFTFGSNLYNMQLVVFLVQPLCACLGYVKKVFYFSFKWYLFHFIFLSHSSINFNCFDIMACFVKIGKLNFLFFILRMFQKSIVTTFN